MTAAGGTWNWRFHNLWGRKQILVAWSAVSNELGAPYWPGYDEAALSESDRRKALATRTRI